MSWRTKMEHEHAKLLGRRLLAAGCPWRWGMLDGSDGLRPATKTKESWPDLRCAGTRGLVLEALRERVGDPDLRFFCKLGRLEGICGGAATEYAVWWLRDDAPGLCEAEVLTFAWEEVEGEAKRKLLAMVRRGWVWTGAQHRALSRPAHCDCSLCETRKRRAHV
jgi:hypothetical protein